MIAILIASVFTLVGTDRSAEVVVPENAKPSSRLCVEELTNYVAKITGRVLKTGSFDPTGAKGGRVVIGTLKSLGDAVPKAAKDALAKAKRYEASWTGTVDGDLWFVGKEETADLYAVYHFLETKLGVRWFQSAEPEDPGDWYPSSKTIEFRDYALFREPDFKYRLLCMNGAYYNVIARPGIAYSIRNGYNFPGAVWWIRQGRSNKTSREFQDFFGPRVSKHNIAVGGGHGMFFENFPAEKYFPLHPEWFPMRDGERKVFRGHCCLSNTNLLQAIVDKALENLKLTGGKGHFSFSQTDHVRGWCECEGCRALDGPGEGESDKGVNVSSRMAFVADYVGTRLKAAYPECMPLVFPYSVYRNPPKKYRYNPQWECQFCDHGRCYGHTLDDPACIRNVKMLEEMKTWLKLTPNMYTFEYFTDTPPLYVCRERDEQADLRFYKSLGMIGWFNEGFMPGSKWAGGVGSKPDIYPSNWQWWYATGHLLWDVDLDLDALLDDAETKFYGPAAGPMKEYHGLRRNLWNSRRECMGYPNGDARRSLLLNASGSREKLLGLLDEAEKLAKNDKVCLFRISRDREWLGKYWIKPNEKARALASNALRIPRIKTPIVIDGDPSDAAWCGALYVDDRFVKAAEHESGRKPVPPELKTSVGIAMDDKNLYFLCNAAEPHPGKLKCAAAEHDGPVWGDDGVEIMIFSPSVENVYYHIAVNTKGVVYDARCPGNDKSHDLGVVAKAAVGEKNWVIEVKVPVAQIHPIVEGEKWRMQIVRNSNSFGPHGGSVSFGGYLPHQTEEYLSFEFGESCVKNGSFDDVDPKTRKPKDWGVNNGEVRKEGANNVLFTNGFTYHAFRHGPLGKSPEPRKLSFSFKAKGKGKLTCAFVRYDDDRKSGEWMPKPWGKGCTCDLTDEWRVYSGEYVINAGEWVAISFSPPHGGCFIDDVNVIKIK